MEVAVLMYQPKFYANLNDSEIAQQVQAAGFDPIRISDAPGYIYRPHTHPETKLLAYLRGEMYVTVNGETFHCTPGDQLLIPGNVEHSAQAGPGGCVYFWSEKLV
jgi:quercetin dioxygenase-like cupin family protein